MILFVTVFVEVLVFVVVRVDRRVIVVVLGFCW